MKKLKFAFKYRIQLSIILFSIGVILVFLGIVCKDIYLLTDIFSCIGTSLVSASVTMFLVKYDIIDLFKQNNISGYGIIDIKSGRNALFQDDQINCINCRSWEEFLRKSSDKTIDIVGISMYSFLWTYELIDLLLELSSKKYTIRIIFANPNSTEVEFQSMEEKKPGKLSENISYTMKKLTKLVKEKQANNIKIYSSLTLPRAFIVRSGGKMIITPYLLRGPFFEPTIIADQWCIEKQSYYNAYSRYIEDLIASSQKII